MDVDCEVVEGRLVYSQKKGGMGSVLYIKRRDGV